MDRIAFFRTHLETRPTDRFARYSLALELKKAGDPAQAEVELRRVVADHPDSGAAWLQLGQLLEELERLDEAKQAYEDGLAALAGAHDPDGRKAVSELQQALDAVEDAILYR